MLNESPFESGTFRAQTGGAYNFPAAYGLIAKGTAFPAKGTIPQPSGISGTIISTGKLVRGTNTLFLSQIGVGDYIYAKDVIRQVKTVYSDTTLELSQEFPTDISVAVIPLRVHGQGYTSILAKNTHASADSIVLEAPMGIGSTFLNKGSAISYDATGSELEFTVTR